MEQFKEKFSFQENFLSPLFSPWLSVLYHLLKSSSHFKYQRKARTIQPKPFCSFAFQFYKDTPKPAPMRDRMNIRSRVEPTAQRVVSAQFLSSKITFATDSRFRPCKPQTTRRQTSPWPENVAKQRPPLMLAGQTPTCCRAEEAQLQGQQLPETPKSNASYLFHCWSLQSSDKRSNTLHLKGATDNELKLDLTQTKDKSYFSKDSRSLHPSRPQQRENPALPSPGIFLTKIDFFGQGRGRF